MNPRRLGALLLVVGAFLVVGAPSGFAQSVLHPIQLSQVSWDMDATGVVPNSEYGHVHVAYSPSGSGVSFLNIVAKRGAGSNVWLVQNAVLLDSPTLQGDPAEFDETVDLSGLGVSRGVSNAGATITYSTQVASTPSSVMPVLSGTDFSTTLGSLPYSFGKDSGSVASPELPPPNNLYADKQPWNGSLDLGLRYRFGYPNGEQGTNQCGPAALTNSIHWLAARFPAQVNLMGQTYQQTLDKFKLYTNWTVTKGISQQDAIVGKLLMASDASKSFSPNLDVQYQADKNLTNLGASVTAGTRKAFRNGTGGPPDWSWAYAQMFRDKDIELSIDWLNKAGQRIGGHVVSLVGVMKFGNKLFCWTKDDRFQAPKVGGVPPANGGTRTLFHQVIIEPSGHMQLTGFKLKNRVKAVYAEGLYDSPKTPGLSGVGMMALAAMLSLLAAGVIVRRRSA